jgi:hypothetical protein
MNETPRLPNKPLPPLPPHAAARNHYQVPRRDRPTLYQRASILVKSAIHVLQNAQEIIQESKPKINAKPLPVLPTVAKAAETVALPLIRPSHYQALPPPETWSKASTSEYQAIPASPTSQYVELQSRGASETFRTTISPPKPPRESLKKHTFAIGSAKAQGLLKPIYGKLALYPLWKKEAEDALANFNMVCKKEVKENQIASISTLRFFSRQIYELKNQIAQIQPEHKRKNAQKHIASCQKKLSAQLKNGAAYFDEKFKNARQDGVSVIEFNAKKDRLVATINEMKNLASIQDESLNKAIEQLKSANIPLSKKEFELFTKTSNAILNGKGSPISKLAKYDDAIKNPWLTPEQKKMCLLQSTIVFDKKILPELKKGTTPSNIKDLKELLSQNLSDELRLHVEKQIVDLFDDKFIRLGKKMYDRLHKKDLVHAVPIVVRQLLHLEALVNSLPMQTRSKLDLVTTLNRNTGPVTNALNEMRGARLLATHEGKVAEKTIQSFLDGKPVKARKEIADYIYAEAAIEHLNRDERDDFPANENIELLKYAFPNLSSFASAFESTKDRNEFTHRVFEYNIPINEPKEIANLYTQAYAKEVALLQAISTYQQGKKVDRNFNFLRLKFEAEEFNSAVRKVVEYEYAKQNIDPAITAKKFSRGNTAAIRKLLTEGEKKHQFKTK